MIKIRNDFKIPHRAFATLFQPVLPASLLVPSLSCRKVEVKVWLLIITQ